MQNSLYMYIHIYNIIARIATPVCAVATEWFDKADRAGVSWLQTRFGAGACFMDTMAPDMVA